MKFEHIDIAGKEFDYILHLDATFDAFAVKCLLHPEALLAAVEEAISTRHHEATMKILANHPRVIWYLEIDTVGFYYQVLPHEVEIGDLVRLSDGVCYESSHDLLASFTE